MNFLKRNAIPLAIVLLAAALRFYHLDLKSLWGDEIGTARWSLQPLSVIWNNFLTPDHFFLNFAIVHFVRYIGSSDFWLRLPSAFAGILVLPVVYGVGVRLTSRTIAIVAMLFMAVAPFQIWYSQEARMYEPLALYALLALYFFLRLIDKPNVWVVIALGVANSLTLYDHLFGAFVIIFELVAAGVLFALHLLRFRRREVRAFLPNWFVPLAAALVLNLLLIAPIVPGAVGFVLKRGAKATSAVQENFRVTPAFLESLVGSFGLGAGVDWRTILTALFGLIGLTFLLVRRSQAFWICALWIGLPLVAIAIVAPPRMVVPRHLIFMQPIYLLMAAAGVVAVWGLVWAVGNRINTNVKSTYVDWGLQRIGVIAVVVILCFVLFAPLQAMYGQAKINDWRSIAAYIEAHAEPGDVIISDPNTWSMNALAYYFPNLLRYSTPPGGIDTLQEAAAQNRRLWYVSLGDFFDATSTQYAQDNLAHINDADWQRDELEYDTGGEFEFPQSESPAKIYFMDGDIPSQIIYHGRQGFANNDAEQVRIEQGEKLEAKLKLPIDAPRVLQIEFTSKQPANFVVSVDGQEVAHIQDRAQKKGARHASWKVPDSKNDVVLVRVENKSGENPLFVRSLLLRQDRTE